MVDWIEKSIDFYECPYCGRWYCKEEKTTPFSYNLHRKVAIPTTMSYGEKILMELLDEVDSMTVEEYEELWNEAKEMKNIEISDLTN